MLVNFPTYPDEVLSSLFEMLLLSEPFRDLREVSLDAALGLCFADASSLRGIGLHFGVLIEDEDDVEQTDNVSGLG